MYSLFKLDTAFKLNTVSSDVQLVQTICVIDGGSSSKKRRPLQFFKLRIFNCDKDLILWGGSISSLHSESDSCSREVRKHSSFGRLLSLEWLRSNLSRLLRRPMDDYSISILVPLKFSSLISSDDNENSSKLG